MPGAALATLSSTVARSRPRSAPAAVQIPASHAPQQRHSFVSTRRPPAAAAGKAARVTAAAATAGQAAMAQVRCESLQSAVLLNSLQQLQRCAGPRLLILHSLPAPRMSSRVQRPPPPSPPHSPL